VRRIVVDRASDGMKIKEWKKPAIEAIKVRGHTFPSGKECPLIVTAAS